MSFMNKKNKFELNNLGEEKSLKKAAEVRDAILHDKIVTYYNAVDAILENAAEAGKYDVVISLNFNNHWMPDMSEDDDIVYQIKDVMNYITDLGYIRTYLQKITKTAKGTIADIYVSWDSIGNIDSSTIRYLMEEKENKSKSKKNNKTVLTEEKEVM